MSNVLVCQLFYFVTSIRLYSAFTSTRIMNIGTIACTSSGVFQKWSAVRWYDRFVSPIVIVGWVSRAKKRRAARLKFRRFITLIDG